MLIRKPSVAGSFYPSEPSDLRRFCENHLPLSEGRNVLAAILPHAGYIYSGKTACKVLSRIHVPDTVILMGPNHKAYGADFAVFGQGEWETPLGRTFIDAPLAQDFLKASELLVKDEEAHTFEHSLEVLLPFLQFKNPHLKIVPLIVGTLDISQARRAALAIGEVLSHQTQPYLVAISNDMSHYDSDESTRKKDQYAIDAILNLDADALIRAATQHDVTMCGIVPVYMLLCMKEILKIKKATLIDYTTSAETSGDYDRVVGYAGFILE